MRERLSGLFYIEARQVSFDSGRRQFRFVVLSTRRDLGKKGPHLIARN